jgi:hypothetical protein
MHRRSIGRFMRQINLVLNSSYLLVATALPVGLPAAWADGSSPPNYEAATSPGTAFQGQATAPSARVLSDSLPPLLPGESVPDGSVSPADGTPRRMRVHTTAGRVAAGPAPVAPVAPQVGQPCGTAACGAPGALPESLSVIIDQRKDEPNK